MWRRLYPVHGDNVIRFFELYARLTQDVEAPEHVLNQTRPLGTYRGKSSPL